MPGKFYTTAAASRIVGVSTQTLHNWIHAGYISAPRSFPFGIATMYLWTNADLRRARKFKGTLKRGRPPGKK